jgi:hypothetical protein
MTRRRLVDAAQQALPADTLCFAPRAAEAWAVMPPVITSLHKGCIEMFNDFLFNIAANFAYDLLKTSMTRLHEAAFGDAEQQAMSRVYERAFAAMLKAMVSRDNQDTLGHLDSVLRPLLQSPDVSRRLMDIALAKDYKPSVADLHTIFESASRDLGRDLASLANIQVDLDVGLAAFIQTLRETLRDEAGKPNSPLHNRVVVRHLDTLFVEQEEVSTLVREIFAGQSEATERLRKIEGQQQEILAAIERALGQRVVQIAGDVSGSIIITGDGNHVQWSDSGHLADWWRETVSNLDALLPQYLNAVAETYAPLYFPLGHLSQPIPLSEVYVDLPIVKPATDEAFLRLMRPGERWGGEMIRRVDHLLQRSERAALVGILGTGKTTTLHYLTWTYSQRPQNKFYWRSQSIVPFCACLRDLAELWTRTERVSPERFVESLAKAVAFAIGGAFSARSIEMILQYELSKGNALVLLDALDEYKASEQERSDFVRALQGLWLSPDFKANHVLLTSRPYGFMNPMGFSQYGLQELDDSEYLVFRLGRAILKQSRNDLSEVLLESWLQLLYKAISQPRFREFSSPLYLTLMVYLGTSEKTAEEGVSLLNNIERLHDPYRFFLYKTIEWEEMKGNDPGVEPDTALLVLAYTAYFTFVESVGHLTREWIANALQISPESVVSVQKFWRKTGLLWEDEFRGTLGFRHAGFQAFGVAFALADMTLHIKADKVNELWYRYELDPEWNLIWRLFMSLRAEEASKR